MIKPQQFSELSVLITGGTSGIGLASAQGFAKAGVKAVGIVGRNVERAADAARGLKADYPDLDVHSYVADVTSRNDVERLVAEVEGTSGAIDVLVNCAGGDPMPALFHTIDIDAVTHATTYYMNATLLMCRAVIPGMYERKSGSIINVASDAAKVATTGETVIGAAMAAITMFSKALAMEAKRSKVRVNAVTPSIVRSTRTYGRIQEGDFSARLFAKAERLAMLGVVEPAEVAEVIVFLGGPLSSKVTGQAISVNGGISAG
ncbi:SDR family oxidoreductase [Micromonospora sp. STR1s_5]|nr:SDR family oxidoreductase [Micromonospora sp. STR1s_5]